MHNISLVDETFDLNFSLEYNLSILASQDGFSFSILDTIQNKVVYLSHHDTYTTDPEFQQKKIKTIYEESELLELPFKKTSIHFSTPENLIVIPSRYFQKENMIEIYASVYSLAKNTEILNTYIPEYDIYTIYAISKPLIDNLHQKHAGIDIQNDLSICAKKYESETNTLIVRIFRKHISILLLSPTLLFCNSFAYEGENDMLYYILGACKTASMEPAKVILEGMVNKHSEIYHRLRQYFENVTIAEKNNRIYYSYLMDKLPDARFATLFNSFS